MKIKICTEEIMLIEAIKNSTPFDSNKPIKVYEVGGCVRDRIRGEESKDIDILVCNVSIEELKKSISVLGTVTSTMVGEKMNVLKINIFGQDFDISIPRTEVYDGSNTHNGVSTFGDPSLSVEDDMGRRDFRCNSIALDLENFNYVDPYNGLIDIVNKKICFVGNPEDRIKEDPLRIIRAIQFSIRFDYSIEEKSYEAMKEYSYLLSNITSERILEEFRKAFEKNMSDNNHKFVNYITDIPFFATYFGLDLFPIKSYIIRNKFLCNIACLFYNGGDFKKLKLDNHTLEIVNILRRLKSEDVFEVIYKKDHLYFDVMDCVFSVGDRNLFFNYQKLDLCPLHPKFLAISSEELTSLGFSGKELGMIQKELCQKIYTKEILANEYQMIMEYLENR